jgi:hypothetical protein
MVKYPSVRARLLQEIDEAVAQGQLDFPCNYNDAIKLDYLQVAISN